MRYGSELTRKDRGEAFLALGSGSEMGAAKAVNRVEPGNDSQRGWDGGGAEQF